MKTNRIRYKSRRKTQRGGMIPAAAAACTPCMAAAASNPITAAVALPVAGAGYVGYRMCGKKRKKQLKRSLKHFINKFSLKKKKSSKKKKPSKKKN